MKAEMIVIAGIMLGAAAGGLAVQKKFENLDWPNVNLQINAAQLHR